MLGYYEQPPEYLCIFKGTYSEVSCTREEICTNSQNVREYKIDYSSDKSLVNWYEQLDLVCEPDWKIALIGSAFFVGWVITLLWVPRISDKHGRKKM